MWSYEIVYSHLNLPKKIIFDAGEITYLYDATGVKLKKTVTDENTKYFTVPSSGFFALFSEEY